MDLEKAVREIQQDLELVMKQLRKDTEMVLQLRDRVVRVEKVMIGSKPKKKKQDE